MTDTQTTNEAIDRGDALAERLFLAGLNGLELLAIDLGRRLGLYEALRDNGALTSSEFGSAAGISERYAREWLEQQAVAAIIDVDNPALTANERRYTLPESHQDVLLEPESLRFSAPIGEFLISFSSVVDELAAAYRTGGGIPYERYGAEMRNGQGAFNRPLFTQVLTTEWLPNGLADLDATLRDGGDPRVADIGCGVGWSSIAIGRSYPRCRVDGIDADIASVDAANKNSVDAGVAHRVTFRAQDAAEAPPHAAYDAVFILEALHDMSQPVTALSSARQMLKDGGICVVMDEKVADEFTAPGDKVERFMYAASVLHCLPVGLASQPSAATGTVMRRSTLERYATEAGFSSVSTVPVEHDFFRLYRLQK